MVQRPMGIGTRAPARFDIFAVFDGLGDKGFAVFDGLPQGEAFGDKGRNGRRQGATRSVHIEA